MKGPIDWLSVNVSGIVVRLVVLSYGTKTVFRLLYVMYFFFRCVILAAGDRCVRLLYINYLFI
jgi:hypothetical protein